MDIDRQKAKESYRLMTKKEKIQYILQSYRLQILLGIFLIAGLIMVIGRFTFNKPTPACLQIGVRAKVLDPYATEELPVHLAERFPEMIEGGDKEFQTNMFYAGYNAYEVEEANATVDKLAANVAAGLLDVLVGDIETLERAANMKILKDLREVFTEEELVQIEALASARSEDGASGLLAAGYVVLGANGLKEESVTDVPYFICITGADEGVDAAMANEPCYLAIIINSPNIDNVKTFIWDLLGENAN